VNFATKNLANFAVKPIKMSIKSSELILNPDGSVYHLNLKPDIAHDIILWRSKPSGENHPILDSIEFSTQKEFKTQGIFKGKRITVMSTEWS
jgi:uridine phosphorylase